MKQAFGIVAEIFASALDDDYMTVQREAREYAAGRLAASEMLITGKLEQALEAVVDGSNMASAFYSQELEFMRTR